jgi:transcription elongation GreA/GreB family factor
MTQQAATGPFASARRASTPEVPTDASASSGLIAPSGPRSCALVGSRVLYRDEAEGEVGQVAIVTDDEPDFRLGLVSEESPLGRALLGRRVGERVKARTPGGVRVLSVIGVEP